MRLRDVLMSVVLGWSALKRVPKLTFYDSLCFILRKKRLLSCGVVLEARFGLKVSCPSALYLLLVHQRLPAVTVGTWIPRFRVLPHSLPRIWETFWQ